MGAVIGQRIDGLRRRHAVAAHADIADYSRLMADDADATVATVQAYQQLVADAVAEVGGTVINFVGDSFLAVFDDARTAMRAAMSICAAVRDHNRDLPDHRRTWFRLGLDAGQIVIAEDGRHFGDPLNIAARIQAIAEVGGINVTEAVYAELDEPALRLVDLGERRLKNIPEMVRVYRLVTVGRNATDAMPRERGTPTLAVMPTFSADDPADRAVADALRLDLVHGLGGIPGLEVTDVGAGANARVKLAAVETRYVLESRVVRSGTGVRAYASLYEVATMNLVWGQRWEGSTDDVFALQDRVTADTVRAMEVELVIGAPAVIYRAALDAESREAVYRGWHELSSGTREGWRTARRLFATIVRRQPDEVSGYALGAYVCWYGAVQGMSDTPEEDLATAAHYAARGVDMDDPTGLSQMVAAALRLHAGRDLRAALASAEASLQRRPSCDVSYGVLGSVQRYLGDWQSAVGSCQRALQLSPLLESWYRTVLASAYYVGQRYHDAARMAEAVVDGQPDSPEALLVLAASQQALGLPRRARATVATLLDRFPDVRREVLPDRHPFRDPGVLRRWTDHLAAAGLP